MSLTLTSLGGAGTVTGSRHLLEYKGQRLLIDCGLFQGYKALRERNWAAFPIDPKSIDAIVLTHAHIDHSGYLPKLVREGYRGPVYCSSATKDLCEILLRDSAYINERDAERANRYRYTKHKHAEPLYTVADAELALKQLAPIDFHQDVHLAIGADIHLRRAGHILGASTVEVRWGGKTIVFSGDLGRYGDPFMFDPEPVTAADYVVVESTYGNRTHPKIDPMEQLGEVIDRTVKRGGTVIIPSFAVGRAQLILYHIWMLKKAGRFESVPIYLDSPMAINATELLCAHLEDHRFARQVCEETCAIASYARDVEDSKAITSNSMPKVVIAASGMVTGGRVLHHVQAFGGDQKNTLLFAGYQAGGTRGDKILKGASKIKMFGQDIRIGAEVTSLPALSAHADADELMSWLGEFETQPTRAFIVHGEPDASDALSTRIEDELGWRSDVVAIDKSYDLGGSD
ncbi:MAG TPA: MBL fold metallo-hydrolase [Hyphomonas sp.]|uniref:MBL fold metallo-hydrolase n=1 Tax=uncultured Hyphomonas sp. TaxID=225298 RepID=UPI000C574EC1|nr:MBL fold metallo-hydrolase [Hyphomonas sp.]MAN91605.1 MBL fold metallo-hydrolase [Hyphomonadaceae bacterium]HBL93811.1 MBL fold metallo-hydrolase [Hyphomonas sp.]HCJ18769.1 MBL fold metallo-hydrolase [Hyphomonas sp.]|tara:strand:- start:19210 stop:20583 length:1374 start_codon:yes stop_codon:yes gene_type:complete